MANLTLSISEELFARMGRHREFNWSAVARQAIEAKVADAEMLEDLKAISEAKRQHRSGKTVSHERLLKKLGLENAV